MEAVCRVCLADDRYTYPVVNTALEQTYDVVTGVKLQQAGRSTALCCVCLSQLRQCRMFIETARESNDALDRWYQNHCNTDWKPSKRPLISFIKPVTDLPNISGPRVKEEPKETEDASRDGAETFITIEIKHEVTQDDIQNDPMLISDKIHVNTSRMTSRDEKSNIQKFDTGHGNTQISVVEKANILMSCDRNAEKQKNPDVKGTISDVLVDMENNTAHSTLNVEKKHALLDQDSSNHKGSQKNNLKRHLMTHTGVKPFACDKCDYRCIREHFLIKHFKTHTGEKSAKTGEKSFACDKCDYKSALKIHLKTHLMKHNGEKPVACDKCSYRCIRRADLKKHKLTHTGEKSFACDKCDYKSSLKNNLKRHFLTHTGEKPFACDMCDYRCIQRISLKLHLMSHTGER